MRHEPQGPLKGLAAPVEGRLRLGLERGGEGEGGEKAEGENCSEYCSVARVQQMDMEGEGSGGGWRLYLHVPRGLHVLERGEIKERRDADTG